MKFVRYGAPGNERPAILDSRGRLRDCSAVVADITPQALADGLTLTQLDPEMFPIVPAGQRLGPPVANIGKIVCVGLNYRDHAAEAGMAAPREPILFLKTPQVAIGAYDPVVIPPNAQKVDWEAELGIVIGRKASHLREEDALAHVAGYCLVNDVSEREWQFERGGTWDKGKNFDTFAPLGPWLVSASEIPDPQNIALTLSVNGTIRQEGTTASMIFGVAALVAYVSTCMTLHPGDIISSGTPAGVGMGLKPPVFLSPGDEIEFTGSGLGTQRTQVLASERSSVS